MLYRACCLPYLLPAYCLPAPATACLPTACYCCLAPACRLLLRLLPVPLLPLLLLAPLLLPTCCNATANTAADTANVADAAAADLRCRRCCHDIFFQPHSDKRCYHMSITVLVVLDARGHPDWMPSRLDARGHPDWMPEAIQIGCQSHPVLSVEVAAKLREQVVHPHTHAKTPPSAIVSTHVHVVSLPPAAGSLPPAAGATFSNHLCKHVLCLPVISL